MSAALVHSTETKVYVTQSIQMMKSQYVKILVNTNWHSTTQTNNISCRIILHYPDARALRRGEHAF